jgi:DNA-binding GntR family transcriptional regulator
MVRYLQQTDILMPTIAARVQSQLAEDIISGKYPPGTRLDERRIGESLQASRTPVREALRQLAARGLVQLEPMRKAIVAQVSLKDIGELLNADCELESLCARLSAESMSAMEKTELEYVFDVCRQHAEAGDIEQYLQSNAEFHRLILEGSHNSVLSRMVAEVRERLSPYRQYHPAESDRLTNSVEAHAAITRHIVAGHAEQAYLAMRSHSVQVGSAALRALREAQAAKATPAPVAAPAAKRARAVKVAKTVKPAKPAVRTRRAQPA